MKGELTFYDVRLNIWQYSMGKDYALPNIRLCSTKYKLISAHKFLFSIKEQIMRRFKDQCHKSKEALII